MKKLLYISVLFLFGMTSCIQDYLDDGGTHSAESNTTPYEYLSSHTYHMFDTLIQIIDHYGLEEEMNRAATVFACSDFSVKALLKKRSDQLADEHGDEGWAYTLDSLYRDFTADSIRIYFFQDKIELATAPKIPTEFLNYSGDGSGYAVYQQESTNESDGKEFDSTAEQLKEQDISVKCQTTGIICTKTGTILHVLDNSHVFSAFKVGND